MVFLWALQELQWRSGWIYLFSDCYINLQQQKMKFSVIWLEEKDEMHVVGHGKLQWTHPNYNWVTTVESDWGRAWMKGDSQF